MKNQELPQFISDPFRFIVVRYPLLTTAIANVSLFWCLYNQILFFRSPRKFLLLFTSVDHIVSQKPGGPFLTSSAYFEKEKNMESNSHFGFTWSSVCFYYVQCLHINVKTNPATVKSTLICPKLFVLTLDCVLNNTEKRNLDIRVSIMMHRLFIFS